MFQIKEDLRIHYSKQYVYEALIELLKTNDYDAITISMIIKKSGVGRTTFYRHFYSKDDVLIYKLENRTFDLINKITTKFDLSIYDKDITEKVEFFFHYWNIHPEIINVIIVLDKTHFLYSLWTTILIKLFSTGNIEIASFASKQYTASFALGGLTSLLIQWFRNNRKEPVAFISQHFSIPYH